MITLLISVGALLVAVIGRAALDPQPIVRAETAAPDVSTSGYGVADDGLFPEARPTTTKCLNPPDPESTHGRCNAGSG